jgi:hypothetical protein
MKKVVFTVVAAMIFGCVMAQVKYDKIGVFGAIGKSLLFLKLLALIMFGLPSMGMMLQTSILTRLLPCITRQRNKIDEKVQ